MCRLFRSRLGTMQLVASLALLAATPAGAERPELVTDRPDQTESSRVVPPGFVQVEVGFLVTRDDDNGGRVETTEVPATLVRIGLMEGVELRLGWKGHVSEDLRTPDLEVDTSGSGDAELGAKVYLRGESNRIPEIALLVGASLPVGSSALTTDRVDPSFRFSFSHTLTQRLGLAYNLGAAWESEADAGGERHTTSSLLYTVALGIDLTPRLGAFVEAFGEIPASAAGGPSHSLDGGLTYRILPNLQLDLAGGVGLSNEAEDWFAGVGVSVLVP
jgi:hypothetical protein